MLLRPANSSAWDRDLNPEAARVNRSKHTGADDCGVEDVAWEQRVLKHTIYARKAKYTGMEAREELKHLREQNARLD
jgi:hypothetical protein